MGVRREAIQLSLEDDGVASKVEKDAAAVALLNRELDKLNGVSTRTSKSTDGLGKSTKATGDETEKTTRKTREYTLEMAKADEISSRRRKSLQAEAKALVDQEQGLTRSTQAFRSSGSEIDKYSGRMSLLVKSLAAVGPAVIPITAVGVPAVAGLTAGLGAAAATAGVAALALSGVSDAVKAIDAYKLDPTTENLQKMKQAMDDLGPSGAQFAKFIDNLEPQLRALQDSARAGLFPGVEEGIEALLPMLPQVEDFVSRFSTEMGDLSAKAGKGLADDPGFQKFFSYINTEGVPILDSFATATGKVASGLAALIADADPLTSMFTTGMLHAADSFQKWAAGLDQTQGFRDFVTYVQQNGLKVAALLKQVATTGIDIATAFAPIGSVTVPILTAVAKVLGVIASSPLGPVIAGMVSISASVSLASAGVDKLALAWGRVTGAATSAAAAEKEAVALADGSAASKTGLAASAGAAALGSYLGVGVVGNLYSDLATKINPSNKDLGSSSNVSSIVSSLQNGWGSGSVKKALDPLAWAGFNPAGWGDKAPVQSADTGLAGMVTAGQGAQAAAIFDKITTAAKKEGVAVDDVKSKFPEYTKALANNAATSNTATGSTTRLSAALAAQRSAAEETGESFVGVGKDVDNTKVSLDGWINEMALQAKALEDFTHNAQTAADRGLKNGLIKELEAAGPQGAIRMKQLADGTKAQIDKANQAFTAGKKAVRDYADMKVAPKKIDADTSSANAKISKVQGNLHDLIANVNRPKVDANTAPATGKLQTLTSRFVALDHKTYTPTIGVDTGNAVSKVTSLIDLINSLHNKTVTVTTKSTGYQPNVSLAKHATGGFISGPGGPRDDQIPAMLSNGEYVVNAASTARWRPLLEQINSVPQFASGGAVGNQVSDSQLAALYGSGSSSSSSSSSSSKTMKKETEAEKKKAAADAKTAAAAAKASAALAKLTLSTKHLDGKEFKDLRTTLKELVGKDLKLTGDSLKDLNKASKAVSKSLDANKTSLSAAMSARDSVISSVTGSLSGDLWSVPDTSTSDTNIWSASSLNTTPTWSPEYAISQLGAAGKSATQFTSDLAAVQKKGITGAALTELLTNGGPSALHSFATASAALDKQYQAAYNRDYNSQSGLVTLAAKSAGQATNGAEITELRAIKKTLNQNTSKLAKAIKDKTAIDKADRAKNAKRTGHAQAKAQNKTAKKARTHG